MREIKFRAWDGDCKKMDYFTLNDVMWNECQYDSDFPFMQYTGLYDKNGKEIYEGDICRYQWEYRGKQTISQVVFEHGAFSFLERNELEKKRNQGGQLVRVSNCNHIEIIGNIYQNPDLLKRSPII